MKHLYFCRHGESEFNASELWAGSSETPLTAKGREQAKMAAEEAKNLNIKYIVCSPLSRARHTAEIIAKAIGYPVDEIDVNSLVVERHFGVLEGRNWQPDLDLDGITDIETRDSIFERARLTIRHLESIPADTILIVSHGHFGRVLRHLLNPEIPFHGSDRFPNATIVKLL